MDSESDCFSRILSELARLRTRVKNLVQQLREAFPQAIILDRIEFAEYNDSFFPERGLRVVMELYIDIDLTQGKSLCWWIELERGAQYWQLGANLLRDSGAGQESIWKASYKPTTVEQVFSNLASIFTEVERFARHRGKGFI